MVKKAGSSSSTLARAIADSKRRAAAAKAKSSSKKSSTARSEFKKSDSKPSLQRFRGDAKASKPTAPKSSSTGSSASARPKLKAGLSNEGAARSPLAPRAEVRPQTLRRTEQLYADPDFEMTTHSDVLESGRGAPDPAADARRRQLESSLGESTRSDALRRAGQSGAPVGNTRTEAGSPPLVNTFAPIEADEIGPPGPAALAADIEAADTARTDARLAHNAFRNAPPPRTDNQATQRQTQRESVQDATRDAVIAQQRANATAERIGEDAPYPAVDDLPAATTLSAAEANDAVARSGEADAIIGARPAVRAPEQEAADRARDLTSESGDAQRAVRAAEQGVDAARERGDANPEALGHAISNVAAANTTAANAGQRAVSAQRDANVTARREGQPLPFPEADRIPENIAADPTLLSEYVATQSADTQRVLVGSRQQIDAAQNLSPEVAIAQAKQAQEALAATKPGDLTAVTETEAAEQATQSAVRAQVEANRAADEAGTPPPYPAASDIPQEILDDPAALSTHLARQPAETQRALVGTEMALTEVVFANDVRDAQRAAEAGGSAGAEGIADVAARYQGNPERVDALIDELGPELDSITSGITTKGYGREEAQSTVDSLGTLAELASEDGARTVARGIIQNEGLSGDNPDLYYLDDSIEDAKSGKGIALGTALAAELDAAGHVDAASDVRSDVSKNLETFTSEAKNAREARETADAELAQDLRDFPFLSSDEIEAYAASYHEENAALYTTDADAAGRLNEVLERSGPELDEMATKDAGPFILPIDEYPHTGAVADAYAELADGPLPARALEWATGPKSAAVQDAFAARAEDIVEDVVKPATAGAYLQYQAEAGGDKDAALDRFEDLFGKANLARSFLTKVDNLTDGDTLSEIADSATDFTNALRNFPPPDDLKKLYAGLDDAADGFGGVLDGAFAAGSFAFAVRNFGDNDSALKDVTETLGLATDGLDIAAKGINSLQKFGKFGTYVGANSPAAIRLSRFGARAVPYLNVGVNALATADSIKGAIDDPSSGAFLKVFGDSLSFVGAVAGATGILKPIALPFEFGGLALSTLGEYWAGADDRNKLDDRQEARLNEVLGDRYPDLKEKLGPEGFAAAIRQTADASDPSAREVAERAGLNTEDVLDLFGSLPRSNNREFKQVLEATERLNIKGADVLGFTEDLVDRFGSIDDAGLFLRLGSDLGLDKKQILDIGRDLKQRHGDDASNSLAEKWPLGARSQQSLATVLATLDINLADYGVDVGALSADTIF